MSTADSKSVKTREFTQSDFLLEQEHILCAIVIGPDRDEADRKTLHLRLRADAMELLRRMPIETRQMILEHQERLWSEFKKQVLA